MYAYCGDMPGVTAEVALRVEKEVGPEPVPGLIAHAGGPYQAGWRIIDVWESQELCERFQAERLGPAVARATSGMTSAPPLPSETRAVLADAAASRHGTMFSSAV